LKLRLLKRGEKFSGTTPLFYSKKDFFIRIDAVFSKYKPVKNRLLVNMFSYV